MLEGLSQILVGLGYHGAQGLPNIYAYDAYADLLPYANQRPPYLARQVEEDWNASRQ